MKDLCWDKKARELQEAADKHNTKLFHEGLRAVHAPKYSGSAPPDRETLLTDRSAILNRWAVHLNTFLNRPSSTSEESLDAIPQRQILEELDLPASLDEVRQTSTEKSPWRRQHPNGDMQERWHLHEEETHQTVCIDMGSPPGV